MHSRRLRRSGIARRVRRPERELNVQVENALVDRILELRNAAGLRAYQAKNLLGRVMNFIELGERVASKTSH